MKTKMSACGKEIAKLWMENEPDMMERKVAVMEAKMKRAGRGKDEEGGCDGEGVGVNRF